MKSVHTQRSTQLSGLASKTLLLIKSQHSSP